MKVLVTGGAGFIGSHLVEELVNKGETVSVIDDSSTGEKENLESVFDDINYYNKDITEDSLPKTKFDVVYHLAAKKTVPLSFKIPERFFEVNIKGTWRLLKAYAEKKKTRFINISSSSSAFCESPYAISKLASEHLANLFPNAINIRYYNVFGERQPNSGAVVPAFCINMLQGKRPVIHGDGSYFRDFTYVGDVVNETIRYSKYNFKNKEKVYKMGYGIPHTIIELFYLISKHLDFNQEPIFKKKRKGDVEGVLATDEIKFPYFSFRKGLQKTVAWYDKEYNYLKEVV